MQLTQVLKVSVTDLDICLKEAKNSLCDFLADETTTDADYDAAENEWDSFFLDVATILDGSEEELENIENNSSDTYIYS